MATEKTETSSTSTPSTSFFKRLEELLVTSDALNRGVESTLFSTLKKEDDDYDVDTSRQAATAARILADLGTPTTSIAVLDDGHITSHCLTVTPPEEPGTTTARPKPKPSPTTLFQACSISKPIFGLLVMHLAEQGHFFTTTTRIHTVLPAAIVDHFLTGNPQTAAHFRTVTVAQLMSHTSGLSQHGYPGYSVTTHATHAECPTLTQIIRGRGHGVNTHPVHLAVPPGLGFMYSGGGMEVLQIMVEHVTGRSLPDLMREYIFDPLGMTRSCYVVDREGEGEGDFADAWENGYTRCQQEYNVLPEMAAGGLWSTPTDLLRAIDAVQKILLADDDDHDDGDGDDDDGGGKTRVDKLMSKETARNMLTRMTRPLPHLGLSWFVNETAFGHGGGNMPSYKCFVFGYAHLPWNGPTKKKKVSKSESDNSTGGSQPVPPPPANCGIAVMTNGVDCLAVILKIVQAIAYLKGWPAPPCFSSGTEEGAPLAVVGGVPGREHSGSGEDGGWNGWVGNWIEEEFDEDEDDVNEYVVWRIVEGEGEGIGMPGVWVGPCLSRLLRAAVPPRRYGNGRKSVDFVLAGMEITMRLRWSEMSGREKSGDGRGGIGGEGGEKVVEIWHHKTHQRILLKRLE